MGAVKSVKVPAVTAVRVPNTSYKYGMATYKHYSVYAYFGERKYIQQNKYIYIYLYIYIYVWVFVC